VFLCFLAFVFWKLDQRTKFLIDHAEAILREMEKGRESSEQLFTRERTAWNNKKNAYVGWEKVCFWRLSLSYSNCFNLVYSAFFLLGLGELLWTVIPLKELIG
jgi:hypothetical protein